MTQDEIIRMAREACNPQSVDPIMGEMATFTLTELERFASLVAAHEREKQETVINWAKEQQNWDKVSGAVAWHLIDRHAEDWAETSAMMDAWLRVNVEAAVLAEREACAKVCEERVVLPMLSDAHVMEALMCAAAIRVRSEK